MSYLSRTLAVCMLAALAGCSFMGGPRELPPLPLLPPADLGRSLQLTQQVTVTFDTESQTFLGAWVVNPETLNFVGLTPSGQRLLTLSYDGAHFSEIYSPMLTDTIPGREVLSHLQLAHWPAASIERNLAATAWRLDIEDQERRLYFKDRLILTITGSYTESGENELPAVIRIRSHAAPYQLEVETLQVVEK